jgi:Tol biopolymer transport system component
MADLKEVFAMATKQVEPDQDSWNEQERRQRRTVRSRKIGAIALAAAFMTGVVTIALLNRSDTAPPPAGGNSATSRLYVVDTVSGATTPFTIPLPLGSHPDYSPDGSQIAYTALDEQGQKQVFVMDADGSNSHQVTRGAPAFVSDWSPDGSMIAFNRIAADSSQEIFLLDLSDGSTVRLTHEPRDAIFDSPGAWASDGGSILFIEQEANGLFYVARTIDIVTRKTRTIARDVSTPSLSPDGTQIAFDAYDLRPPSPRLSIMNSDGTGRRTITRTDTSGGWEAWSPDGQQIAFVRNDPQGVRSTYVYDTTTGEIRFVANGTISNGGWIGPHSLLMSRT